MLPVHFNTAAVELSIFQGFDKMELASSISLDVSSQSAEVSVLLQVLGVQLEKEQ